jgi:uncharacterized protein (TIGR02284 family)
MEFDPMEKSTVQSAGVEDPENSEPIARLIQTLHDGREYYRTAADRTQDAYLGQLFQQMIRVRDAAIVRLTPFVGSATEDPVERETLVNAAGRVWTDIKAAVGETDEVLVETMVSIEEETMETVNNVFEDLPAGPEFDVVQDLQAEFSSALADVREARDGPATRPS